jgi:phosphoribosyl-AMP cyclohydrolase
VRIDSQIERTKGTLQPAGAASVSGFFIWGRFFVHWNHLEEEMGLDLAKLNGLVPAVVQDYGTGEVLMVGFMNEEAFRRTMVEGDATFYSRTRNRLWTKGESSGHRLRVREVRIDCDSDSILLRVDPLGPGVCHEGYRSCFYRRIERDGGFTVAEELAFDPGKVYGGVKR